MQVKPIRTGIFTEGESLVPFIRKYVKKIPEKSVLVVTSKIVALSEGRTAEKNQKKYLIRKESDSAIKTKLTWLTVKDGMLMPAAGIDESNARGKLVLLPKDSFASAERLRKELRRACKVKKLGIIISDSRIAPLRAGTTAQALGYAGIKGIRDYRGKKDLFGRAMKISRTNVADSIATAATLVMGEGNERQPLALITDAPVEFVEKVSRKELRIAPKDDMYWPILKQLKNQRR